MKRAVLILMACLAAPVARAHPHVFVDVGLRFETDAAGRLSGVVVSWAYDDLYSLLILSDRGLDPDADMVLTESEQATLLGFDLTDWPEGFDGALFIETGDGRLPLGPPEALSVGLEDGRLVTRHRRPLSADLPRQFTVRPYDPSYYAALGLAALPELPEGCTGEIVTPDRAAADAKVEALGGSGDEMLFEEVEVGVYYADTLVVTCAPGS